MKPKFVYLGLNFKWEIDMCAFLTKYQISSSQIVDIQLIRSYYLILKTTRENAKIIMSEKYKFLAGDYNMESIDMDVTPLPDP